MSSTARSVSPARTATLACSQVGVVIDATSSADSSFTNGLLDQGAVVGRHRKCDGEGPALRAHLLQRLAHDVDHLGTVELGRQLRELGLDEHQAEGVLEHL